MRVVLLHGQPGSGAGWHRVVDALGDSIEVVAPDRPGYGNNPLPGGGLHNNVEWLSGLIEDGDRSEPVVVVAHSWAGGVALELARRRPELVSGLVLVGSVGPGAINLVDRVLTIPFLGEALMRPFFWFGDPYVRRLVKREVGDAAMREQLLASADANRARGVWRTFLTEQAALVSEMPAVLEDLGAIPTPTVVVAGTRDRVVPFTTAAALTAQLANAELVAVERGGHTLQRSHPRVIAQAVHRVASASTDQ